MEAESAEQAKKAWEESGNGFEYTATYQPDYEWEDDEFIMAVSDSDYPVEDAEIDYDVVRDALGLQSLEEED